MKPKFVVVLAAYNGMEYIDEQINSILNQKNVDLDLFISVDKSSDGTEEYLIELSNQHEQIKLLEFGCRFGGAGPNFYRLIREIDLSNYDFVSFADQDDVWGDNKLFTAYCALRDTQSSGYSSNFEAFWSSGRSLVINKAQRQRNSDYYFESAGPGCTYVLDSELAKNFKLMLNESHKILHLIDYHDWLVYAYARVNNFKWIIDEKSTMRYRQHHKNQIGVNSGVKSFLYRVRKVLDGYAFEQSNLIARVVGAGSSDIVLKGLCRGRRGYLWLAMHANECRRSRLDRIYFFISCLILFVINHKIKSVV